MTRFPPYSFDNELVSANIRETTTFENGAEFVFELNINDDQLKQEVTQRLDTAANATREPS